MVITKVRQNSGNTKKTWLIILMGIKDVNANARIRKSEPMKTNRYMVLRTSLPRLTSLRSLKFCHISDTCCMIANSILLQPTLQKLYTPLLQVAKQCPKWWLLSYSLQRKQKVQIPSFLNILFDSRYWGLQGFTTWKSFQRLGNAH